MPLKPEQRYTKANPCPICGGYGAYKKEKRCKGFRLLQSRAERSEGVEPAAYCQNVESSTTLNVGGMLVYRHPPAEDLCHNSAKASIPASEPRKTTAPYSEEGLTKGDSTILPSGSLISSYTPGKAEAAYADRDFEVSPSRLSSPEVSPRRVIITERQDYPERGRYQPAASKVWFVVKEGNKEITRSLSEEVAQSYVDQS